MGKTVYTTAVLALLLFLISHSTSDIKSLTITSDTRSMIFFEKFRFTHTGHVTVAVSAISVMAAAAQPKPSRFGFLLLSEELLLQILIEMQQKPSFCVLDSPYTLLLFTFRYLSPPPVSFNRSYPITYPDEFSLLFANCAPGSSVSMVVHTELFNLNSDGSRDYLSGRPDPTFEPSKKNV